ncbi:MAG: DUF58 domain-containing protein [Bacteroidota bacterium]
MDLTKVREYGNIEFLAKQLVEGFITGQHKSPFHGFSVEFAEHRAYNIGESTRHIDWRVFAKTDKLFVKRYEEETNLRCYLLIDTSSSMFFPESTNGKLTFSTTAAACLAYLLQKQKDAVSLTTFSDNVEIETPVKSTPGHIYTLFQYLDGLLKLPKNGRRTGIVKVLHYISEKIHTRSLVVIFSDMFENFDQKEDLFMALQHLKHNRHEVLLFHVTDANKERDFDYEDRPYEFTDMESGEKVKIQPAEVKQKYQETVTEYFNEIKLRCMQYKIDFVEADINEGFDKILSAFLMKRNK